MADSPYAKLRSAYAERYERNERLASHVADALREHLELLGMAADVTRRAKDPDSFATKALTGSYGEPFEQVGDQVGARVVVAYSEDIDRVERAARELFDVIHVEDKLDALDYDEVGYLGRHIDLRLHDRAARELGHDFVGQRVEVQVRTIAQSAWAHVSHEQLYKPAADVPPELKRRIYRLVALVELFDNEVAGFLQQARATPGFAEAQALTPLTEALLRRFDDRRRGDRQLSLALAAAVVPLYNCSADEVFERYLSRYIEDNDAKLRATVEEAVAEGDRNPLIHQPELFMLLERLERDRLALLEAWPVEVPEEWLTDLADRWGVRLGDA